MREIFIKHHYKGSYPGNEKKFKSIRRGGETPHREKYAKDLNRPSTKEDA